LGGALTTSLLFRESREKVLHSPRHFLRMVLRHEMFAVIYALERGFQVMGQAIAVADLLKAVRSSPERR
jgi:hypothetical protein